LIRYSKPLLRRLLTLISLGFIFGPVGDYCQVLSGTIGYPQERYPAYFFGMPFWTPLLFGGATLAMGIARIQFDRWLKCPWLRSGRRNWTRGIAGLAAFLILYSVSGFIPGGAGGVSDVVLAVLCIGLWWKLDRTWQGLVFGAVSAVMGTLVEATLVRNGVFYYLPEFSNLGGVPSWLPWLYFAAAAAVGHISRILPRIRGTPL
jgi:hypothetical protein